MKKRTFFQVRGEGGGGLGFLYGATEVEPELLYLFKSQTVTFFTLKHMPNYLFPPFRLIPFPAE